MNWPDFFGRRAKAELARIRKNYEDLDEAHHVALRSWGHAEGQLTELKETNLRLIAALREMDQGTFQISQVAPDWARIRPIFQKMFEATERRMATENDRIKNLMVGEIVTAYNEPKVLTTSQIIPRNPVTGEIEDNS